MKETQKTSGRGAPAPSKDDRPVGPGTPTQYSTGGGWIVGVVVFGLIAFAIAVVLLA